MQNNISKPEKTQQQDDRQVYQPPQIILESEITTRAGSPVGSPTGLDDIDPADLFDN
jgi:hypothetical protein